MTRYFLMLTIICLGTWTAHGEDPALQSILRSREARMERVQGQYDAAVREIDQDALRRLHQLLKARTSNGDLDGALAVRKIIDDIRGAPRASESGDKRATQAIRERYMQLHRALLASDMPTALRYVDPQTLEFVKPAAAKGYLGVLSFLLKAGQITEKDIRIGDVKLGVKGNEAAVDAAIRINGDWKEQKQTYWVQRNGEWYLGDERNLKNFK